MHGQILPEGWAEPKGYANGILCGSGKTLYIGGQIGWNASAEFETDDFVAQVKQALINVKAVLSAAGVGSSGENGGRGAGFSRPPPSGRPSGSWGASRARPVAG